MAPRALLGLVMVVALVAAGCGDDGESGGGTTETTGAAPTVDEALAAKVPDEVKSDGKTWSGSTRNTRRTSSLDTDGRQDGRWLGRRPVQRGRGQASGLKTE